MVFAYVMEQNVTGITARNRVAQNGPRVLVANVSLTVSITKNILKRVPSLIVK
jgi:hypothetical protein